MNRNTIRALLADARYQVFDNVVFRILLGGVGLLIALSFVIAFKDESVTLFYGAWEWRYEDVWFIGAGEGAQSRGVNMLQSIIVEQIVGNFGIMLCIAATAFFTPRLLEKGAADNIFSKPVGRFTLLFSRYLAGIFFVSMLSLALVLGLYAGFAICSGYADTGFLWSAFTLIYLYAILQSVSVLVATVTRNSVAAILVTITFFMLNGCVNQVWLSSAHMLAMRPDVVEVDAEETDEAVDSRETSAQSDTTTVTTETTTVSSPSSVGGFISDIVTPLRTVLPRTGDADILSRKLKQAAQGLPGTIAIEDDGLPVFYLLREPSGLEFEGGGLAELDGDGLRWSDEDQTITVTRRPRKARTSRTGRQGFESLSSFIKADVESLRATHGEKAVKDSKRVEGGYRRVEWRDAVDVDQPNHARAYATRNEYLYLVELGASDSAGGAVFAGHETKADNLEMFLPYASFGVDPRMKETDSWYESQFNTSSSWQFNILASIGSTLAFALVMLLLARWRIRRMDF